MVMVTYDLHLWPQVASM